jgi:hypothetical protein
VTTLQSLSGTGSLRIGAAFISKFMPGRTVYLSNPTWRAPPQSPTWSPRQPAPLPHPCAPMRRCELCGASRAPCMREAGHALCRELPGDRAGVCSCPPASG